MEVDRVDMSLDEIIKLDRKQKVGGLRGRGQRGRGRGTGRGAGRGTSRGGSGTPSGRGGRGASGRRGGSGTPSRRGGSVTPGRRGGTGRGGANRRGAGNQSPRRGDSLKGRGPDRFSQITKRGARGRGRGGISQLNSSQSPGNDGGKIKTTIITARGRGRGRRGRGGTLRGSRGVGRLRGGLQNKTQIQSVGLTSLNMRRKMAVQSLVKARETLAQIEAQQRQKSARSLAVNKKRGLQISNISLNKTSPRGRGQGRARGGLSRYSSTMSINSVASTKSQGKGRGRGLARFGSTVSLSSVGSQKKRGWRQKVNVDDSMLTVSIDNSPPQPQRPRKNKLKRYGTNDTDPVLATQIKNLKPAISQKYSFKKAVFAQASTSTSLNDRFSSGDGSSTMTFDAQGRKVFF